jgi:hypothetical protein
VCGARGAGHLSGVKVKGFYSKKANWNQVVALEFEETEQGR